MNWIAASIKGIMVVSGVLTCSMIYMAIAPQAAMQSTFGETLEGPLAEVIVRNWGALIALVGAMLIYGAYRPAARSLILVVAITGKALFIALVLGLAPQFLAYQAGVAVVADSLMVILFVVYLAGAWEG
jgi:hypothetical protein